MSREQVRELTLEEAARRLGVDPSTAYRWAEKGKLEITTRLPKTAVRILVSEASVMRLAEPDDVSAGGCACTP